MIVPSIPIQTEVIRQRVLMTDAGRPLRVEDESDGSIESNEQVIDPEQAMARKSNRLFWQAFNDSVQFDHPDQPAPRHGGNNRVHRLRGGCR
ncbi:hypothetical protein [Mesorhizobium sp. AA22]|uniref:hypothetical protein n=1 Tax=Mesorhizobium sp. AA22 TaxID=1854057 RepID=UPI000801C18D|nr:hypothetical protein [Mesorhizobium sp. AA22]QIA22546.1 hypothetical protein A9K68_012760 [Mesorhizobium sp. AA22]